MVDDRLKEEFDKRDQMILKLKSGMDKLVETFREDNNNKSLKNGPSLKLHPRAPSSASQLSTSSSPNVSKKGGSALKWGSRSDVPPKRKKRQMKAMMYGKV
jgi:hypothetical protein